MLPVTLADAPCEVQCGIREFWPEAEWDNAAAVGFLESKWNPFADADTTDSRHPCGAALYVVRGVTVFAEHSVGVFQIDVCNFPSWDWKRLWNVRENCGTAHAIWARQGWAAWYFSAQTLGLI
jgi:hypothetical protein